MSVTPNYDGLALERMDTVMGEDEKDNYSGGP